MMDCAIKEDGNSYLIGIYFSTNCVSKTSWRKARNWLIVAQFFLDQCETIVRVQQILVSKNALLFHDSMIYYTIEIQGF